MPITQPDSSEDLALVHIHVRPILQDTRARSLSLTVADFTHVEVIDPLHEVRVTPTEMQTTHKQ